jgi:polyisoprenoid-binding protein YceI
MPVLPMIRSRTHRMLTLLAGAVLLSAGMIAGLASAQAQDAPAASGGAYKVDTAHSSVIFKVKHLETANFYGRIDDVSGSFDLRDGGSVNVVIKTESVNSGNEKRDQHLRGPDFFSSKEFPEATFRSKSVRKTGDKTYEVAGDLTLHGVTRPLTVKIEETGAGKGRRGEALLGIETRFTIKRGEFGMNYMPGPLSDEVELIVALEGAR